jgi:hypothetical protein
VPPSFLCCCGERFESALSLLYTIFQRDHYTAHLGLIFRSQHTQLQTHSTTILDRTPMGANASHRRPPPPPLMAKIAEPTRPASERRKNDLIGGCEATEALWEVLAHSYQNEEDGVHDKHDDVSEVDSGDRFPEGGDLSGHAIRRRRLAIVMAHAAGRDLEPPTPLSRVPIDVLRALLDEHLPLRPLFVFGQGINSALFVERGDDSERDRSQLAFSESCCMSFPFFVPPASLKPFGGEAGVGKNARLEPDIARDFWAWQRLVRTSFSCFCVLAQPFSSSSSSS